MTANWIFRFGDGTSDQASGTLQALGWKGQSLAEMSRLRLPVPPGFTISSDVCSWWGGPESSSTGALRREVEYALAALANTTGRTFGSPTNPLIVSLRPSAAHSVPGLMDGLLNIGLNASTVEGLAEQSGDAAFAYDCYRRFVQSYCDVVLGIDPQDLEDILEELRAEACVPDGIKPSADVGRQIIRAFLAFVEDELGEPFPDDPMEQLWGAVGAAYKSWNGRRAILHRQAHGLPSDAGMAVVVQTMVFGNRGKASSTGVLCTRDATTGEKTLVGEFLNDSQGNELVAGTRKASSIRVEALAQSGCPTGFNSSIRESSEPEDTADVAPALVEALQQIACQLERAFCGPQEFEFTVEAGTLWLLQSREVTGQGKAALKIVVDLVQEGLISEEEAVLRIDPAMLDQLLHSTIDPSAARDELARGLPASPGAACGLIVFSCEDAEVAKADGKKVILVRNDTTPEDVHGMHVAEGILTSRGGMTSHAAVVARGMGKPCVSGAWTLSIDAAEKSLVVGDRVFGEGDLITIDGTSGQILVGEVPLQRSDLSGDFGTLLGWADKYRRLEVRSNAEQASDAIVAREFGAEGIGLCRTEHMFFDSERIVTVREMILAEDDEGRKEAIAKLLEMQRGDFIKLFTTMRGSPVTIRLLDPPLHEFLPKGERESAEVATAMGVSPEKLIKLAASLDEFNPMLGHRGCRLLVSYPGIAEMQARAIFEAAIEAGRLTGEPVLTEIMVPLVSLKRELVLVRSIIDATANDVMKETGETLYYSIGTMVELPRAALRAGEIAKSAEFFSFGTNDLTQTTFGISRDDAAAFLSTYQAKGLMDADPFVTLDQEGVGELMKIAVERGRATRPELKLGICGEHAGDPASIAFCEAIGLDYVSCSPFRVPTARLAAAQAVLRARKTS
ncbi:MAG: pyruvate, phosphate dikinase [Rhodobacteraceae bacterium]|nr:pyruvate, phosphate dikinase [Paracoccaceae bacterium]